MSPNLRITSLLVLTLASAPLTTQISHAAPAKSAGKSASWVALQTVTDKQRYVAGEPIKITLVATNVYKRDAYLKFSSGQRFDLQLFRANEDEPVYTWSATRMFNMMVGQIKLTSGQRETYDAQIGDEMGALAPGTYRLEAHLTNSSRIAAPPVTLTVAPKTNAAAQATFRATTDKRAYNIGEAVNIDFALQNNASAPTTFNFNSGQTYDVWVRNSAGETVWNWGANKRFAMMMREVTLAAGEKQNFSVQWDGRALPDSQIAPGNYTVEAVFTSNPAVRAAPVAIEIR